MRPAAEDDSGRFRVWETEYGPPSHSIPPHLLVKAAARCGGPERAAAVSQRLFEAYFAENLDITDAATLKTIWRELGLDPADFAHTADEDLLQQILEEHREAVKFGVNGVPAVMLEGMDVAITGAHPPPPLPPLDRSHDRRARSRRLVSCSRSSTLVRATLEERWLPRCAHW